MARGDGSTSGTLRALLAIALVALVGCTTSTTSTARPTATTIEDPSGTTETTAAITAEPPTISWSDCGAGTECGTLDVPVDYDDPTGDALELGITRRRATNADARVGILLVNPGGPGGSGNQFARSMFTFGPIAEHFDVIGFDPRGVGDSSELQCNDTLGTIYSVNPAPRSAADTATLLEVSEEFVDACAEKYGDLLAHLGTRNVARDMDQIRAALGEEQLSYVGFSYGTSIGQVYAELFPTRVRAMVLDGVVKLGQPGLDAARAQGDAFEVSLAASFAACRERADCPIRDDPEGIFERVQQSVAEEPMAVVGGFGRTLTSGTFAIGVAQSLYAEFLWPELWRGLAAADGRDRNTGEPVEGAEPNGQPILALADTYLGRNPNGTYAHGFEIYFAVSCLDWDWPSDPEAFLAAGRDAAAHAPHLGEAVITDYVRCAFWPTPPQPLTPPVVEGAPPIVVVSTTEDAATPYANGVELVDRLPGAVLVTKQASTHTAYGQGDACIDDPIDAYLVELAVPDAGLTC